MKKVWVLSFNILCVPENLVLENIEIFLDKIKVKVTLWVDVEPHCRHTGCYPSGFYVDVNCNGSLQSLSIG